MCNFFQVKLLNGIDLHSVSWHNHKQILAFISAQDLVTICDYNDSGNYHDFTYCCFMVIPLVLQAQEVSFVLLNLS